MSKAPVGVKEGFLARVAAEGTPDSEPVIPEEIQLDLLTRRAAARRAKLSVSLQKCCPGRARRSSRFALDARGVARASSSNRRRSGSYFRVVGSRCVQGTDSSRERGERKSTSRRGRFAGTQRSRVRNRSGPRGVSAWRQRC